jgi:hypothetical protein
MQVELRVESAVYVLQEHVEIIRKGDGSLLPFDAVETVRTEDTLSVTARAFDCETLPINRGGEVLILCIRNEASGEWVNTTLPYMGSDNLYSAESVIQWLPTSSSVLETYSLLLQSFTRDGAVTGEVSLTFEVKPTNKTFIIAGSIGAVSCVPLGLDRAVCGRHAAHCDALGAAGAVWSGDRAHFHSHGYLVVQVSTQAQGSRWRVLALVRVFRRFPSQAARRRCRGRLLRSTSRLHAGLLVFELCLELSVRVAT